MLLIKQVLRINLTPDQNDVFLWGILLVKGWQLYDLVSHKNFIILDIHFYKDKFHYLDSREKRIFEFVLYSSSFV